MNIRTRAATPATAFLLAAFILLLLSCISVPITKTIALGAFNGVTFGVFGFCIEGSGCSAAQLGYNPNQALQQANSNSGPSTKARKREPAEHIVHLVARQGPPGPGGGGGNNNFSLPPSARNGLSNILIVHVIAAALTLIALVLSLMAHIRSPSHSTRFLLAIFIIQILTTLLTLLSFLVDLLVFVPHFAFGTWLVLAATICNAVATSTSLPPESFHVSNHVSSIMLWAKNVDCSKGDETTHSRKRRNVRRKLLQGRSCQGLCSAKQ